MQGTQRGTKGVQMFKGNSLQVKKKWWHWRNGSRAKNTVFRAFHNSSTLALISWTFFRPTWTLDTYVCAYTCMQTLIKEEIALKDNNKCTKYGRKWGFGDEQMGHDLIWQTICHLCYMAINAIPWYSKHILEKKVFTRKATLESIKINILIQNNNNVMIKSTSCGVECH